MARKQTKFTIILKKSIDNAIKRGSKYVTAEDIILTTLEIMQEYRILDFSPLMIKLTEYIKKENGETDTKKVTPKQDFEVISGVIGGFDDTLPLTTIFYTIANTLNEHSAAGNVSRYLISKPYYTQSLEQYEANHDICEIVSLNSKQVEKKQIPNTSEKEHLSEKYPHLEEYGENLTLKNRKNPLINREHEIERIYEILLKKDKPNPILTGLQGVGKTSIVEEIAVRVSEGNVPLALQNEVKYIYSIQMSTLLAGSQFRGEFEERLTSILDEVKSSNKEIILYIDEMHTMMRSGVGSDGTLDAANIIKPYLTDGSIRIIGSTTNDEYRRYIEKDKAMARRLMSVDIPEPSPEDTVKILNGIKSGYEKFHGVKYTKDAIQAAVDLSVQHINDRYLPDKAIDLIDEAGAKNSARIFKDEEKKINTIDVDQIEEVLYDTYKIPQSTVSPDESECVKKLADNLETKVFGQRDAVEALIKRVKLAKAGIRDKNKPIANILFVGPTGTGKTEISKVLADSLNMKLLRFDMSEYQEEHTVAKLFGSPAGYVGYDDGGLLTNEVRSNPNCILLLDEIEKAHPKIYNALLQVMDYGIMTDSKGVKVDFRNTILIMTSNAGAAQIVKKSLGFGKASEEVDNKAMDEAIKASFAPEFRGRLTDVIKFNDLTPEIAGKIVAKEIMALSGSLADKNVKLTVTDECIRHIADIGYTPMTGARNIKNIVTNDISNLLVDDILFGPLKDGGTVKIDWDGEYKKTVRAKQKKKTKEAIKKEPMKV